MEKKKYKLKQELLNPETTYDGVFIKTNYDKGVLVRTVFNHPVKTSYN